MVAGDAGMRDLSDAPHSDRGPVPDSGMVRKVTATAVVVLALVIAGAGAISALAVPAPPSGPIGPALVVMPGQGLPRPAQADTDPPLAVTPTEQGTTAPTGPSSTPSATPTATSTAELETVSPAPPRSVDDTWGDDTNSQPGPTDDGR